MEHVLQRKNAKTMCVSYQWILVRVKLPFRDGIITRKRKNVCSLIMVAVMEMATILRHRKIARKNVLQMYGVTGSHQKVVNAVQIPLVHKQELV